ASAEGRPGSAWNEAWPASLANRDAAVLASRRETNAASLRIVEVEQFLFRSQWDELRSHALAKGVRIIGDLPIFVAMDSADAWAHPHLFQLNDRGQPTFVAGVPPDYFSADGQLWGNPLYAWENHEADGFSWWLARVEAALSLYDILRIDHFRGLAACWAVPAAATTAKSGSWEAAPGERLLTALKTRLGGELPIIAEDLGFITDDVRKLRDDFGLPGMRILQFGFDARESGKGLDPANPFLPHNYPHHCVVYTGTHDNDTLAGWLSGASTEELAFVRSYLGYEPENLVMAIVREAMKSAANTCVIPMQDILGLGRKARMNVPGTSGGNWTWRLSPQALDGTVAASMRALSQIYSRSGPVGPGPVQGAPRLT
ncbi:MAG: 4-alpha-glucanotransferase, partial [Spirochaetales bacterium]|nr:4-alpha-glucanotransferase [Spirochaetales bacterium]